MRKVLVGLAAAAGAVGLLAEPAAAAAYLEILGGRAEPTGAAVIKYELDCGRLGETAQVTANVSQGRAGGTTTEWINCDARPTNPKTIVVWPAGRRDFRQGPADVQLQAIVYNENGNVVHTLQDSETVNLNAS